MDSLTPQIPEDRLTVNGWGPGVLKVGGVEHRTGLLVKDEELHAWGATSLDDLDAASFEPILRGTAPEILILGTGGTFAFCPPALKRELKARGTTVEAMATPAACRTFNVLVAEARSVAAALLLVETIAAKTESSS